MNKLFLVMMAVCLVSVHAFVKRDAPATEKNYFDEAKKQLDGMRDTVENALKTAFDPKKIEEGFNDFAKNVNEAISKIKPATETKKE